MKLTHERTPRSEMGGVLASALLDILRNAVPATGKVYTIGSIQEYVINGGGWFWTDPHGEHESGTLRLTCEDDGFPMRVFDLVRLLEIGPKAEETEHYCNVGLSFWTMTCQYTYIIKDVYLHRGDVQLDVEIL